MNQKCFAFYAFAPQPIDATPSELARCTCEADAVKASLDKSRQYRMPDGRFRNQTAFAGLISKTPQYISQIKTGVRTFPDWMVDPFCRFTGTNLLKQYRRLQEALADLRGEDSDNARCKHIAATLRIAPMVPQVERRQTDRRAA